MEKNREKTVILNNFKQLIYVKSDILKTKKKMFKVEYKKYKQLVQNEKLMEQLFLESYGEQNLNVYKKIFQADKVKNKIFALYFQIKILQSQIRDLKEFFDNDYYNSMEHIAKQIYKNVEVYNFYNQKDKDYLVLDKILTNNSNEKVKKSFFEKYNNNQEKLDTKNLLF